MDDVLSEHAGRLLSHRAVVQRSGSDFFGQGRLYVFRPDLRYMGLVRAEFRVDAVPAMQLDNNGYSFVDLSRRWP
jgi:hypothetical protein